MQRVQSAIILKSTCVILMNISPNFY